MTAGSTFDGRAITWDDEPRRTELARKVADAVIEGARPTSAMDVLDYGCGTGLVTMLLQPRVRSITGVDSSKGMLEVLARKISEQGVGNVHPVWLDPERGERPTGEYHLVVSSMTLHHVADLPTLVQLFHDLLLPGGTLCLADLDREDGTFHDDHAGVFHMGMERGYLAGLLEQAGFTGVSDTTAAVIRKGAGDATREYPVFFITARRGK